MLLFEYFNSSNVYRNSEPPRNKVGRRGIRVKKENEKFTLVPSRSSQNLEFGYFTLSCTLSNNDDDANENVRKQ